MRSRISAFLVCLPWILAAGTGCVHTPAGTNVEIALAKKPELVRLPPSEVAVVPTKSGAAATGSGAYESDKTELLADAFSRGEFCMNAGKDVEAISAFREVVKLDPHFTDAWGKLAALYEKNGQEKEALEAFRHAKMTSSRE